ncbi:MAG: SRPBCC family protein [Salinigranum sp.]
MDEIVVSTVVYLPPEDIYEFLVEFPRYAKYSKHLEGVTRDGDGSPGTVYGLRFAWWKLTYTARSEVTDLEPPTRIDWRLVKDVDSRGRWLIEPLPELPADAPEDAERACRVYFMAAFDPDSVDDRAIDLPTFVSLEWVVEKVKPIVQREAERVVERFVRDIEGRSRRVELTIHDDPDVSLLDPD